MEGRLKRKGFPVSKRYDELPNGVEELKKMQSDLKAQVRKLQREIDVCAPSDARDTKKTRTDPKRLYERGEGGGDQAAAPEVEAEGPAGAGTRWRKAAMSTRRPGPGAPESAELIMSI